MSKVKVGIIGASSIIRNHLDVISSIEWIEEVGITSRTRKKTKHVVREYGITVCSDDVKSLIEEACPDLLMLLVSADQIFTVARKVMLFGLLVFIEKSPRTSLQETRI